MARYYLLRLRHRRDESTYNTKMWVKATDDKECKDKVCRFLKGYFAGKGDFNKESLVIDGTHDLIPHIVECRSLHGYNKKTDLHRHFVRSELSDYCIR